MAEKVKFVCSLCGQESWFHVSLESFIIRAIDLVCDDCLPEDDEVNFKIESRMIKEA